MEYSINKAQNGKAIFNGDGGDLVYGLKNEYAIKNKGYNIKVYNSDNSL